MSTHTPEVLTGTRAPRTVRLEEAREREAARPKIPALVAAPDGVNVYVARDRRYRVQITAPQHVILGDGRKQSGGKMIVAQFEDCIFRNDHKDPKVRALIDSELRSNKYFGRFGDSAAHFWLASEQNAVTEKARVANALATIKAMPKEAQDAFIASLAPSDAVDHELPAAK